MQHFGGGMHPLSSLPLSIRSPPPSPIQHPPLSLILSLCSGLLGGHFAAKALRNQGYEQLAWYQDELLRKAEEVGRRLLPAFDTTTGLPYPKVRQEETYRLSVSLVPRPLHLGWGLRTRRTGS